MNTVPDKEDGGVTFLLWKLPDVTYVEEYSLILLQAVGHYVLVTVEGIYQSRAEVLLGSLEEVHDELVPVI